MIINNKIKFDSLTSIRAIAAFMVYLHHFNPLKNVKTFYIGDFISEFHIGVTIFFVLSGFLISYNYLGKKIDYFEYFLKRFARIYPIYFLLTIITFILTRELYGNFDRQFLVLFGNLIFIRGFFDKLKFTLIGQGWSLSVEEIFYLTFPVLLYLSKKSFYKSFLYLGLSYFIGISLVLIFNRVNFYGFFVSLSFMFQYTFFGRVFEFFIGFQIANLFKNYNDYTIKFKNKTILGIIGIIMSLFCLVLIKNLTHSSYGILHPIGQIVNNIFLPLFISLLLIGLITELTPVRKVLENNFFKILGLSSYIFYLIHTGIVRVYIEKLFFNINNSLVKGLLIFLLINFISIVLHFVIEEPIRILILKKYNAPQNSIK
jgi:peptidoglycan/LPS O-acetylase OafA/YrhL